LLLLGSLWAGQVRSQGGCEFSNGNRLRVCGLEGNQPINYDPSIAPKVIDFTLHSRLGGNTPWPYTVTVTPLSNPTYSLSSGGGDQANFSLTFKPDNEPSATTLSPGAPSGEFTGSTSQIGASLSLTLTNPDSLVDNNYSGDFEFLIEQYFFGFPFQSLTVYFTINLAVPTRIIVKNFDDMDLFTNTASLDQPIEGYENICVGGIGFANYTVNLSSENGSTGGSGSFPFQLNGASQNLPYTAEFINNTSSTIGIPPDANGDISQAFPRAGNENCTTDNARVIVSIAAASWESANETSYTDKLTVTVTPQ
jgi:hypothetical protein